MLEPDNPVRAIESFVCALDLAKLGFRHADRGAEAMGQPPYDPADLLKLYLYGYINQVRSSRRLEREACRNLELIWLLKNLRPGYRTIANFRKENWEALKAANRGFVLLVRELGLVGGSVVAIDGSFFHGDASKASIFTRKRLAEQIAKLDLEIEAYGKSLEDNDAAEAKAARIARRSGRWRRRRWRRYRRQSSGADGQALARASRPRSAGGKRRDAVVPDRS